MTSDEAQLALPGGGTEQPATGWSSIRARRPRRQTPVGSQARSAATVAASCAVALAGRGEHDRFLGRVGAGDLGGDRALVQDEDPVGHREDLGQVARDEDDREAGRGELRDDPVDLDLGADVDAAGRLVEDQHARLGRQPLAEHDLLLVAARQRARELVDAGRADPKLLDVARRRSSARSRRGSSSRGNSRGRIGSVTFDGDREVEDEAVLVAVLGDVGDARRRAPRTGWRTRPASPPSRISPASARSIAEQDAGDLGPARRRPDPPGRGSRRPGPRS